VIAKTFAFVAFIAISIYLGMMFTPSDRGSVEADVLDTTHHFIFSYNLGIENLPDDAEDIEIWIPFPLNNQHQQVASFEVASDLDYEIYSDPVYGNKIMHFISEKNLPDKIDMTIDFKVARSENSSIKCKITNMHGEDASDNSAYLSPNKLVPLGGVVAYEADSVVEGLTNEFEKIETLYSHLTETMRYDKSGTGWGNGDAIFACDTRTGNCTDIHSLFISMARSLGIPARFIIGFPLPENEEVKTIAGYHCWAEFYIEDKGWIPVDISEAIKHPDKEEYFFGQLDQYRISLTIGRDIELKTKYGTENLNYFVYPYVLVNGKKFEEVDFSFEYKRI